MPGNRGMSQLLALPYLACLPAHLLGPQRRIIALTEFAYFCLVQSCLLSALMSCSCCPCPPITSSGRGWRPRSQHHLTRASAPCRSTQWRLQAAAGCGRWGSYNVQADSQQVLELLQQSAMWQVLPLPERRQRLQQLQGLPAQ